MRLKRDKFIETKGYDVFTDPGFGDFYREATRLLGADGPVQVSALLLDDRVLAAHWGYVADDRFYYLMPAHEFRRTARLRAGPAFERMAAAMGPR